MFLAHTSIAQAEELAAAVVGAMRLPSGWCSAFQPHFLSLIFRELLEVEINFEQIRGLSVAEAGVIFIGCSGWEKRTCKKPNLKDYSRSTGRKHGPSR